jgi:sugar O-acyltransferase (sialic acid O-acetyltransferase NeuD family)
MHVMKQLVIFGLGKIGEVAYRHILRDNQYEVVAFTCDSEWLTAESGIAATHFGLPVVAFEDIERHFPPESVSMFVAIGYHDLNAVRARKCREAKTKGYTLISYVSPRCDHGPWLELGENCLILDGVGIQPGVRIGNNVSLWNNALIGHHSIIQDDCWIAAGATLGGSVTLGERSFVGLNATLGGEISIGADCFLGGGSLVLKSAAPRSVFIARGTDKFRLQSDEFLRMTTMPALATTQK